jgi:hypothetical protein
MMGAENEYSRPPLVYTGNLDDRGYFDITTGSASSSDITGIEIYNGTHANTAATIKLYEHRHTVTPSVSITNVSAGGN